MKVVRSTLVLMFDQLDNVLLGMKKRGFGVNKWNGFGGKIEAGETIRQAAVREVKEECNLTVNTEDLNESGLLQFKMHDLNLFLEVSVLTTQKYTGEVQESSEMRPRWYSVHRLPFDKMWKDDQYWFPLLLKGQIFHGLFQFKDTSTITNMKLTEYNSAEELLSYYVKGDIVCV